MSVVKRGVGFLLFLCFIWLTLQFVDKATFGQVWGEIISSPSMLAIITVTYTGAFISRGIAWRFYSGVEGRWASYLVPLYYSLFFNHLLPFKAGDLIRIGVYQQFTKTTWKSAASDVIVMRSLDLFCLAVLAIIGTGVYISPSYWWVLIGIASGGLLFVILLRWKGVPSWLNTPIRLIATRKGVLIVGLVAISWILEGYVLYGFLSMLDWKGTVFESLWATSVAVASGVFQITPGNLAAYESVMTGALVAVGLPVTSAYLIALTTHIYKFIYSFAFGILVIILFPISFSGVKEWLKERVN
ncbi:hypothetical protein N781_10290 [Pontibacillus halophilus JSM 076056 = DSM 19796]|uniref:Phosphatidylglycerol lysyltransferase n=1 Tax=Pontibacillus halophilus JSM 076056 = DSM 19796 TaxID=1385510 RepID=A0A0A5GR32_9BACI|nr:lysylphosphatidylglycerol synthase transmembrane domain-containing protein [Pontibacillus halophilus]KGX93615.1 hypothetical protein N781_10290 [Pontibacillus halophilus JSM 076056 = DSM 19796]